VKVVTALGTHQGMSEDHLARHLGYPPGASEATYPGWTIFNHESWRAETFTSLEVIGADRLRSCHMETLEPLTADEDGVIVDIDGTPTEIVQRALLASTSHRRPLRLRSEINTSFLLR
jgi:hypothetical protein